MANIYIKRSALLLGAAAIAASATAGAYRDVTGQYMNEPAWIPGWQGALAATSDGVGEVWNGAFRLYQTLPDMPAGEYTLKADALYRCGNNDFSKANMANGANHYAFIFINGEKKAVKGLFDGRDTAPNDKTEAAAAFAAGEYANEITVNHPGGDMVVGIVNEGGYGDEWCCFDNFQLFKGSENLTSKIKNADFSGTLNNKSTAWDYTTTGKTPDVNKGGGVFRKTNATGYNIGQQVELPAGKYRFSMLTFHRYGGSGNANGKIVSVKGEFKWIEAKSPKDWFDAGNYEANTSYTHSYIYMCQSEIKPQSMDWEDDFGDLNPETDKRTRVKDCWEIWNGEYDKMPENETRADANGNEIVPAYGSVRNVVEGWGDSGIERESAAHFVLYPEKYRQFVEFELTAPTKVWVGLHKIENTSDQYWQPWADIKLEKWDENAAGIGAVVVEDENAPVEYYNLQGVRVANPANGLFIVKKGNKATKQYIR